MGTILFVHGTGIRLKEYKIGFQKAREVANAVGLKEEFVECAWGDPLGIQFEGNSLPDPPTEMKLQEESDDFARWNWLFADPLFELGQLTIHDTSVKPEPPPKPGSLPDWKQQWDTVTKYQPSDELNLHLARGALDEFWAVAWSKIVKRSPIPLEAFKASARELPEAHRALARSVIAQLHVLAVEAGVPGPSRKLRIYLYERLLTDWKQEVFGVGTFFAKIFRQVGTNAIRRHRNGLSDLVAPFIGDILLYQSRGEEIRQFIRNKIESAKPPVTIVAHSLGGIACVDLLMPEDRPEVNHLVTAGSQSPLLYEIGALSSLKPPKPLPDDFPPWLNFYDRNDFLSYLAKRLWPKVEEVEIESGQPFPDSHSSYFGNDTTWLKIRKFIK